MPEISRFFGIVIGMFYSEHGVPHLHAAYGKFTISVEIQSLRVQGRFPPRAQSLVLEWTRAHRQDLLDDWQRARAGEPLRRIAPLE